ncbi:hypothetical protein C0J52_01587 [Blattella germanica]|nr:hypothetical protein C0J52_01587 [Blattella germanica]
MTNVEKCIHGNTQVLFNHGIVPSLNITEDEYESAMNKVNLTDFGIKECSLKEQLDQAAEGTGLAFIVFTQAIVELPGAPFWSVIFFLMLLSLGIGSQIGILEGMLCTIFDIDIFKRVKKQYVTGKFHKQTIGDSHILSQIYKISLKF